ncbi:MAG: PQQ-binding-like beta-propeller repeat protein [Chloroflexota bacterium]
MKTISIKTSRITLLGLLAALSLVLSACGGQPALESWPGTALGAGGSPIYLASGAHIYTVDASGVQQGIVPVTADAKVHFFAPPAEAPDGSLIGGSYDHKLYSMQLGSDQQNWVFAEARDRYVASPLIVNDLVLAPNADGNLYALGLDGALRWKFTAEHGFWATPLLDGQTLYAASKDHRIYALELSSGRALWETEDLGGEIVSAPRLGPDGLLYVGTFGSRTTDPARMSRMVAVQAETGKTAWSTPVLGWVWGTPVLADGTLYFGDQEGYLYSVNAADGKINWQVQLDTGATRAIVGAPLLVDDGLYFVNKAGNLYRVNPATGAQVWMQTVGGQLYTTPLLVDGKIVVAPLNFESLLVAYDTNGARQWAFTPAGK